MFKRIKCIVADINSKCKLKRAQYYVCMTVRTIHIFRFLAGRIALNRIECFRMLAICTQWLLFFCSFCLKYARVPERDWPAEVCCFGELLAPCATRE